MAQADHHFARFTNADLDLILGFDPEVHPAEDIHEKLANYRRYVVTVQSMVDDALETW
jgi:hypothetical protein